MQTSIPSTYRYRVLLLQKYEEVLISPYPDQEGNKLWRPNSGFIQHTPHKAQYTSYPVALTSARHSKKIQVVHPSRSPWQQCSPHRTKNGNLSIVFSVQGTGGSPTGPDLENRVGEQDSGSLGRPVSSGFQVSCEPGHCRARTRPPWRPSRCIFPSKCPSIAPAEMSNTPR